METNLVLGATGGIGRVIVKALREKGEPVKVLVRNKTKAEKYLKDFDNVEIIVGDAANREDVADACRDCKNLFYGVNIPYPEWGEKTKDLLTSSIQAAVQNNAKLIFPGNVYVYGHPRYNPVDEKHPHDAHTKKGKIRIEMEKMLENAASEKGLRYTIVRMPDFYGPYVINGFYEKLFIKALEGKTIQWIGDLDVPIEYIFIEDAGKAMVIAVNSEKSDGEEFNVRGYAGTTARKFLEEVAKQANAGSKVKGLNSNFMVGIFGLFDKMAKEFKEMMYLKQEKLLLNGSKFKKTFGQIPATPYQDGIAKTLSWAKNYFNK